MARILVSFLGKVAKDKGGTYKTTAYDLDGQTYATPFFALALTRHHAADTLRILGTAGSMWDVLSVELEPDSIDSPAWDALERAVAADAVTQDHLDAVAPLLDRPGRPRHQLRLIPYGADERGQVEILRILAEGFGPGDRLLLDVTHGLRHLPMLGLISAFYLRAVAGAEVGGIYYAPYEREREGATPALRLDGLMNLYEWLRALECFNKDGDYGVFGGLLQADGLRGDLLTEAAFLERVAVAPNAKRKLDSFMQDQGEPASPAGRLFLPVLEQRIDWRRGRDRAAWEGRLARNYLERGDYLRAAQFGFEARISGRVIGNRGDPGHYDRDRQDAEMELEQRTKDDRLNPQAPGNFITLKNLRNALSHGLRAKVDAPGFATRKTAEFIEHLLGDEAKLRNWLTACFRDLPG